MSNRLQFFRDQMAAFEGAINPRKAIVSGYYVPEPRRSVSELITRRLELRPSSTHLLLGGIGSGKTTQLLVTQNRINQEIEDVYAHYVDVSLHTDISKLSTGSLIAVAGVVLSELLKDSDNELVRNNIERIQKFAHGYSERKSEFPPAQFTKALGIQNSVEPLVVTKHHEAILAPKDDRQAELRDVVNQLDKIATEKYGEIVLLLDGLDRLDEIRAFSKIITTDVQDLSSIGVGVVLVGPLSALYHEHRDMIEQAVHYFDYQACFDVENDADSHTFFQRIIETRASKDFIEDAAVQVLIRYSGGVLRDLINLTQASIEEAYLADSDTLQATHVEQSVISFGRTRLLGLSEKEIQILLNVLGGNFFFPKTHEEVKLLVTGRILEYKYPERRYAVHPTIAQLLQLIHSSQQTQPSLSHEVS